MFLKTYFYRGFKQIQDKVKEQTCPCSDSEATGNSTNLGHFRLYNVADRLAALLDSLALFFNDVSDDDDGDWQIQVVISSL